ncbi:MAG: DNA topoisomerase IB [Pseudomonadota bacterium]
MPHTQSNPSTAPKGLRFYPDTRPGITRRRRGRGFSYTAPDGTTIECKIERKRLDALAVPPAYEDVWIAPIKNAHLLATGRDAEQRKQYKYHPDWSAHRAETKYASLADISDGLPALRRWISRNLKRNAMDLDCAVAVGLALIDRVALRPGRAAYAQQNKTFGATTLRPHHVQTDGDIVKLAFRGKGGHKINETLQGRRLAKALERCQDLPGAELITWLDKGGETRSLQPEHLSARLDQYFPKGTTPKTLRTWHGSLAAFKTAIFAQDLRIKDMSEAAAARLHNTPAIARKSYIHPDILDLVDAPLAARRALVKPEINGVPRGMRKGEACLAEFLQT